MEGKEQEWKSWVSIIRSTVLTSKNPLTPREIERDIRLLEGQGVPYKKFNYPTLEKMLSNIPGLKIFQSGGQFVIQAIATEETAHIQDMIRKQKPAKKKSRAIPSYRYSNNYSNKFNNYGYNRSSVPKKPYFTTPPIQRPLPIPTVPKSLPPQPKTPQYTAPIPSKQQQKSPTPLMQVPTSLIQQRLHMKAQELGPTPTSAPPVVNKSNLDQRLTAARTSTKEGIDSRITLLKYTQLRGMPDPVYITLEKSKNFYASVEVDNKKFSSYPQEAKTKDEAQKIAAKVAVTKLTEEKTTSTETRDRNLIVSRVLKIVNEHPNGLFETSVLDSYVSTYNEGLPKDWLKIVENSISVETGANNITILSPRTEKGQFRVSQNVSSILTEPESLKINSKDEFWMRIYVVYSTTDLWGVIISDDYDKFVEFSEEIQNFYKTDKTLLQSAVAGKYYVVLDEEGKSWHRVRCVKSDSSTATVFFIDRGDEDQFPISKLRTLHPQFCQFPAQSVQISMNGFEPFEESAEAREILEDIILEKDVFVKNMSINKNVTSVQLWIEENEQELSVNKIFRERLLKEVADPHSFIGVGRALQQVHISHVSEDEIYVQVKTQGSAYLQTYMTTLTKDFLSNPYFKLRPVLKLDASKTYATKMDDNWYRVKITKIENENLAEVRFIDLGEISKVHRSSLVLLEDISEIVAEYPPQALAIALYKISSLMFDKKMANHLRKLAPKTEVFYMKVVGEREGLPMVEFYKRTESNLLASLNDTIALEPEITSKDANNNAKPRLRNDRSSLVASRTDFPLATPNIPGIDKLFDVTVVMAAHPGNFTVQPHDSATQLEDLMIKLSNTCNFYAGPALKPGSLKVGSLCAAKYDDGRWYRAYISKVITENAYAVYFVDYGDYKAVSLEFLQPLQDEFTLLPYQAIRAKLYGCTPKSQGDWTVTDSLRFNELVVNKAFVSCIKSCDNDDSALSTGEIILGLQLIDTTDPNVDVYIHKILVDENRAEYKE